ncbi:hypothetical protein MBANPS3_012030 [Mucor bainieri]
MDLLRRFPTKRQTFGRIKSRVSKKNCQASRLRWSLDQRRAYSADGAVLCISADTASAIKAITTINVMTLYSAAVAGALPLHFSVFDNTSNMAMNSQMQKTQLNPAAGAVARAAAAVKLLVRRLRTSASSAAGVSTFVYRVSVAGGALFANSVFAAAASLSLGFVSPVDLLSGGDLFVLMVFFLCWCSFCRWRSFWCYTSY